MGRRDGLFNGDVVNFPPIHLQPLRPNGSRGWLHLAMGACLGLMLTAAPAWAEEPPSDSTPSEEEAEEAEPGDASESEALKTRVKALEEMVELMSVMGSDAPAPAAPPTPAGGPAFKLDLAFILDVAAAWFSHEPLQTGAHDPGDTGFHLQQLEMSLGANVDHLFELKSNLVFSPFGVEVEEAYGRTLSLPGGLQARVGQFLTRMGRLNPTHPHAWSFIDQPLVNGTFLGSEGSRGLGFELSWLTPAPWYLEVVTSMTDAAGECCARSFLGGEDLEVRSPLDFVYTVGLRQFFDLSDDVGLAWGLTTQLGPNATGNGNRTELYGLSAFAYQSQYVG